MKAVFMERNNVLYEGYNDKTTLQDVKFYPYSVDSLRSLAVMGYVIVILENGIKDNGRPVHWMLSQQLEQKIKRLAAARFVFDSCFHDQADRCDCRMPKTAMIDKATEQYELNPADSVFVAGSLDGLRAAEKAGIGTVMLLKTGVKSWRKPKDSQVRKCADLAKAVEWIKENAC